MFTIKHVENNGYECCRTARTVDFHPQGPDYSHAEVTGYDVPGTEGVISFVTGRVFVMNEQGRTVANYDLYALNKNKGVKA